jgi:hypothetical protein
MYNNYILNININILEIWTFSINEIFVAGCKKKQIIKFYPWAYLYISIRIDIIIYYYVL